MEDWTDIFAEGLKDIEETLPADDWTVVRQKYFAVKRRRRAVIWSSVAGVAAVLAVFAVLFSGDVGSDPVPSLVTDNQALQSDLPEAEPEEPLNEPVRIQEAVQPVKHQDDVLVAETDSAGLIEVVKDTTIRVQEVLVADNQLDTPDPEVIQRDISDEVQDDWEQGEWIDGKDREEPRQTHRSISVGVSGSRVFAGGSMILMDKMDMDVMDPPANDDILPSLPGDPDMPSDTSSLNRSSLRTRNSGPAAFTDTRSDRAFMSEEIEHNIPVSYGVSARFTLTKRFSVNTGLNYTLYTSRRTRRYSDGTAETDRQMAHYLGIPFRCDWMIVDRPRFGMYVGAGIQVDRCIYAKVGNERLYDDTFLWSLNGALGVQYNITPALSLYAEPELTANLGYPQIRTYRDDAEMMLTARFGLRINL